MELTLANPWGLLGLLSIPAIVAIHCLQRRNRSHLVSTLFLVPQNPMAARSGSRFQFWRNSASFWMQVLVALLLTWVAAQPRWIAADFRQRVVLIYDASVSMQAFEQEVDVGLSEIVESMQEVSRYNEWLLLASDARSKVLYRGTDADQFLKAAMDYIPSSGQHSYEEVLRFSSQLGSEGAQRVIFLTDHIQPLPEDVELYAVGRPLENVGFSGLRIESRDGLPVWRASVRNYGQQPVRLEWQLKVGDAVPVEAALELAARSTKVLTSGFPSQSGVTVELQLPDDVFAPDNRITIFQPKRKDVLHTIIGSAEFIEALAPLIESVTQSSVTTGGANAHFEWIASSAEETGNRLTAPYTVRFNSQDGQGLQQVQGLYTVESDPLMEGLSWHALVYPRCTSVPEIAENERVLLWHNQVPLISVRERAEGCDLHIHFDPLQSNALRLPGFLILLNRFVTAGEMTLPLPYRANFEGNQSLGFEHLRLNPNDRLELSDHSLGAQARDLVPGQVERAPVLATTLSATLNASQLLEASVFFAETTEADLLGADSENGLTEKNRELIESNSREDFLTPVWLILAAGALLLNWYFIGKGR